MSYSTLITTVGSAKIAAAVSSSSTVNLTYMALGDGNGNETTPSVSQSALVREVYRANINTLTTDASNPTYMVAELIVPTTVGGWTVREVGLLDNEGNLIAVGNFPATYKPELSEGSARDLVVRMIIEITNPQTLTLKIDASVVLASRQWVSDNFSLAVVAPGGTTAQVLSKASNSDGDVEWVNAASGLNILVNVVTELQTLAASQTAITLATCTATGVAVYVNGIRLTSSQFTIVDETHLKLASSYTEGSTIFFAQNEPANKGDYLASGNYLSEIEKAGTAAQEIARGHLGVESASDLLTGVLDMLYPIGEILITHRTGTPNTWSGAWANFGSWQAYAAGRVLVGLDTSDATFNTLDAVGGVKTVTLSTSQMPSHSHSISSVSMTAASSGTHTHSMLDIIGRADGTLGLNSPTTQYYTNTTATTKVPDPVGSVRNTNTAPSGAHTHTVTFPGTSTYSSGSDQAHSNLQPYQVVYMWKRVA